MRPSPEGALLVVIDPCVFAHELMRPGDRPVCCVWRDRRILPVINRRMLNHTLGFLRSLELYHELLQLWALWLTHRNTAVVLPPTPPCDSMLEEYANAVILSGAEAVVTDHPGDFDSVKTANVRVISPETMLTELREGR